MNGTTSSTKPVAAVALKRFPDENRIVLQRYYNRDNNEVVEFSVLHQSIGEFMLLRKSICLSTTRMTNSFCPGCGCGHGGVHECSSTTVSAISHHGDPCKPLRRRM